MFPLQDHFDVANLLGHPAFDHLATACSVFRRVNDANLSDPSAHDWPSCSAHGLQLRTARKSELKACVHAVVLFQAMMEKVPYFVPTIGGGLNPTAERQFAASWESVLDQISDSTEKASAKDAFNAYNEAIYRDMRNPVIHGRQTADISKINLIRTVDVHAGMKVGWRAYDYLLTEVFRSDGTNHNPSWAKMCTIHGVPEVLDTALFPDLVALSSEYTKRHMDGARAAMNADSPDTNTP